ncbi:polyprenol reductase [Cololabis saira]|uniref:polyprenol reductase n=1 Tax=Cololabis saira TaxID=129043 RepID=UPI002AD23C2E|nr:polyprenol reductase [Cololabis saira]
MIWSSASLAPIDALWFFLASCFLVAFSAHKISTRVPKTRETSGVYGLYQDIIRYGKTKQDLKRADWLRVFDVPKRWFWHFYAVSVGWNGFLLALYVTSIYPGQSAPSWLTWTVDVVTGVPGTDGGAPQLSAVLLQLLLCLHSLRRLLECLFVSVFSDGVIHVVQYAFGLGYYVLLGLTVLSSDRMGRGTDTLLSQLDCTRVAGVGLFIGASWLQHQSIVLLARLRTGKSGSVETLAHRVPKGGWFELVSCPHYFAELLIYISFSLVFGGHSLTWWLVVLYVLFNQALAGQLCHDLYISKFKLYPKHRRAFIPYVL